MFKTLKHDLCLLIKSRETTYQTLMQYFTEQKTNIKELSEADQVELLNLLLDMSDDEEWRGLPLIVPAIYALLSLGVKPTSSELRKQSIVSNPINQEIFLLFAHFGYYLGFNFSDIPQSTADFINWYPLLFIGCIAGKINAGNHKEQSEIVIQETDAIINSTHFSLLTYGTSDKIIDAYIARLFLLQGIMPELHDQFDFLLFCEYTNNKTFDLKIRVVRELQFHANHDAVEELNPYCRIETFQSLKLALEILHQQKINTEGVHQPLASMLKKEVTPSIPSLLSITKTTLFNNKRNQAILMQNLVHPDMLTQDELNKINPPSLLTDLTHTLFRSEPVHNLHLMKLIKRLERLSEVHNESYNSQASLFSKVLISEIAAVSILCVGLYAMLGRTELSGSNHRDELDFATSPLVSTISYGLTALIFLISYLRMRSGSADTSNNRYGENEQNLILAISNAIYSFYYLYLENHVLLAGPLLDLKNLYMDIEFESIHKRYGQVKEHTLKLISILRQIEKLKCVPPLPEVFTNITPTPVTMLHSLRMGINDDANRFDENVSSINQQYPKHARLMRK